MFSWSPDSAASTDCIKLINLKKVLQSASQSIGHAYNTWAKAVLWANSYLPSADDEFLTHKLSAGVF